MQVRLLENLNPSSPAGREWESLVRSNKATGAMQSLYWRDFKVKQGLRCLHLAVYDDGRLVGGGIFYAALNTRGAGILVCPEGPVLPWSDVEVATDALRLLLRTVKSHAPDMQAMAVRIEPRITSAPAQAFRGFGRAPVDLVPRETLYIDLTMSDLDLLASMRPKGRYNINVADRHGVTVYEEGFSRRSLSELYSMLLQASLRDNFSLEPISFFSTLTETLCPQGVARLLFAEHGGELLGGLLLLLYGGRATYLYGGIGNTKRNLMAGYALQWTAMRTAKHAGCHTYDMYGFDRFRSPGHEYARFSQFKSQFGGTVMRFVGAHDYFFVNRLSDVLIKAISEIEQTDLRTGCLSGS